MGTHSTVVTAVRLLGLVVPWVVGSTPTAGQKVLGKLLTPHYPCPPCSSGYLVEHDKNVVNGVKLLPLYAAWLHSPEGDKAVFLSIC